MHIKWIHGQWETVFGLSDRLNIVGATLTLCIVHTVNSFAPMFDHFQNSCATFLNVLSLSPWDIASFLCMAVAICNIVLRFKNICNTYVRTWESKTRETKRGARRGFDRLALGLQLDLSVEVR